MNTEAMFKDKVLGHPSGLFVLFFTEMWERFSYYGMRSLLVMFLTASLMDEGWAWPREHAYALFGSYTALVYLSTMLGGYFADKVWGYRKAVVVGAVLMTLGHGAMALETAFGMYAGLILLVFGSGFFKPNMTSIISHMYKNHEHKKDGAFTIFYMGVNAGAFLGILLCGYLGEKVGWSLGFGLAGVFMLLGMLQFWYSQSIFGNIGLKPNKEGQAADNEEEEVKKDFLKENMLDDQSDDSSKDSLSFPGWQLALIGFMVVSGLVWIINDPMSKIYDVNLLDFSIGGGAGTTVTIVAALVSFIFLTIYRLMGYNKLTRDKMFAVGFFAVLTMFFLL